MIVFVDFEKNPPEVGMVEAHLPGVVVQVLGGGSRLAELDQALATSGAGRAVGHHAELSVGWLKEQHSLDPPTSVLARQDNFPHWLCGDRLDATRRWFAAPIQWPDSAPTCRGRA